MTMARHPAPLRHPARNIRTPGADRERIDETTLYIAIAETGCQHACHLRECRNIRAVYPTMPVYVARIRDSI